MCAGRCACAVPAHVRIAPVAASAAPARILLNPFTHLSSTYPTAARRPLDPKDAGHPPATLRSPSPDGPTKSRRRSTFRVGSCKSQWRERSGASGLGDLHVLDHDGRVGPVGPRVGHDRADLV